MFTRTSDLYDALYAFKDYAAESARLIELINEIGAGEARTLLDIACGTGRHIEHLKRAFDAVGVDIDDGLLKVARNRCPEVEFIQADMVDLDLGRSFDVITCLFSSIGYVKTVSRLKTTVRALARHLYSNGMLIVEPWFSPETYEANKVHAQHADFPDLKISRMSVSKIIAAEENLISPLDFEYLVATSDGITHLAERHLLGLFTDEDYRTAFNEAGLVVSYNPQGLTGRGLWIGKMPAA